MVDFRVVEHEYRGAEAGGGPGVERVDNKSGVERTLTGGRVQVVGRGVVEAQPIDSLAVPGPDGDVFARKLPAVRNGRGEAKPGFIAVKHVHMAFFFQLPHPAQAFGFVGVVLWVLRLFQGVAKTPPATATATLFKKRHKVLGEKFLANPWRNVAVISLICCRLVRTTSNTGTSSAAVRMDRRPYPAALASPARPPVPSG